MAAKERRKFMRIDTDLEAQYWAKGPSMVSGDCRVRDFSRQGLGVDLPASVRQGEHVELTLKVPGDNVPIIATAQVTWTGQPPETRTQIRAGLKFLTINPLDLARLLDFVYSRWLGRTRTA